MGTGKTLLCRKFLATLDSGWVAAYIPKPSVEARTLLLELAEELGVRADRSADQHRLLKDITRTLLELARQSKRVVLCMGVPRLVNILSQKALLRVYGEGGYRVKPRHVQAAAQDTPAAASGRWSWPGLQPQSR